ncbi:MAG: hypothetical protein ACRD2L_18015 [Terriglobia bacterium]
MTEQTYQRLIIKGIQGLPSEALAEIADFIYFLRKRALQPQAFAEEIQNALLGEELRQLSREEEVHLEKEFEGYDQLHPRE